MAALWSDEARFARWRDVELAALDAMVECALAPPQALRDCRERAGSFTPSDVERIDSIEGVTQHDVIAFLTFMEERIGPSARHLHWGMTSSDVIDTGLALALREAADHLLRGVAELKVAVKARAYEHRMTPMIGRTHGIHAEPTTFGLKLAIWYDELTRAEARLRHAREVISVGKISGAVGTFAHLPPRVESLTMQALGLKPAPASNQVIQRDRHAEYFTTVALVGASLEKFATEIRHLQRTEVGEVQEAFRPGQKGSSAMPHKRNPIRSENITGLARMLRGYALVAMENVALWHERDISHSSAERSICPDATATLDFMLARFTELMRDLIVYPERMKANLALEGGTTESQRLLLALARAGVDRQRAYEMVQRNAARHLDDGIAFETAVREDAELMKLLPASEVAASLAGDFHTKHVDTIFERVFGSSEAA